MLTKEQNERFTRVGPGTACGELMRRYWHPIAALSQMKDRYTVPIRLLGEDLVLYKDRSGTLGLIEPFCAHRRMGLVYGIPEQTGLRCPYHGWRYDETGQCIEQPFEETDNPESNYKDIIRLKAYPVQVKAGIVFAYLGPAPAPLIPNWDVFAIDGVVRHLAHAVLPCSWLQCQENSLDPVHVEWLHGHFANFISEMRGQDIYYRGTPRKHAKIGFDRFDYGIYKRHGYVDSEDDDTHWADGHPIVFPYYLRQGGDGLDRERWGRSGPHFQIRVPRDDTHTDHWWVLCHAADPDEAPQQDEDVPVYEPAVPEVSERGYVPWHLFESNPEQDIVAWITQGEVADRTLEHLGGSDKGILLFRHMLEQNISIVEEGGDPMNTFRDAAQNVYLGMRTEDARRGGIGTFREQQQRAAEAQRSTPELFGFRSRQGMVNKLAGRQEPVGAPRG